MPHATNYGFPPVLATNPSPTRLVLGSMPGVASLQAQRYYSHPRNAFWPIVDAIFALPEHAVYETRIAALQSGGVALWDVLRSCVRKGSLDSAIERESEVANDFANLFAKHPTIVRVCFNGAAAELLFERHCRELYSNRRIEFRRLPSTSPAFAGMSFEAKLAEWRAALSDRH
jgi:double-stranded uracil-DNA glycosylase